MIFETMDKGTISIPNSIFLTNPLYLSHVRLGKLMIGNKLSPDGANSLEYEKILSMKKAFSEAIERRNLLLGGITKDQNNHVLVWDILNKKEAKLPFHVTTYSTKLPHIIDTTGGAAHFDSRIAVKKGMLELLEKNAMFLFWYGRQGKKGVFENFFSEMPIYQYLVHAKYDIQFFINDFFSPLKVVFTILTRNGEYVSGGLGSNVSYRTALENSFKEAYLLGWQNEEHKFLSQHNPHIIESKKQIYVDITQEQLNHIKQFAALPEYINDDSNDEEMDVIKDLATFLPKWIKGMYVIPYKNKLYPKLKYVKVFSYDLYNHVPYNKYINVQQSINKYTLKLSQEELDQIPDCIFV